MIEEPLNKNTDVDQSALAVSRKTKKLESEHKLTNKMYLIKRFIERNKGVLDDPSITWEWACGEITKQSRVGQRTIDNRIRKLNELAYRNPDGTTIESTGENCEVIKGTAKGDSERAYKDISLEGDPIWEDNKLKIKYSVPEYPGEVFSKELDLQAKQEEMPIE